MKKHWDRPAMRIASAKYVRRQGMLDVTFENGDHFLVAVETVLPVASNGRATPRGSRAAFGPPQWAKMRISETGDVLEVPALGSTIEIPWDRIRSIADPEFRSHLADKAAERARRIGGRIRAKRLEVGMTRAALAETLGVPRDVVADWEAGNAVPQMQMIDRLAAALGMHLRDFADE